MSRLFLFCVTLTLLLAVLCAVPVCGKEGEALAVRLLGVAIRKHDAAAVGQILRSGLIASADVEKAPTPFYWVANEREDSDNLVKILQLLMESFGETNYDYGRYHPLTRAVSRGLHRVVGALLQWPQTIPEVLASYMRCEDLAAVPSTVTVVVHATNAQCFHDFPRVVQWDHSRLASKQKNGESEAGTQMKEDWSNPFLRPPKGLKPPAGQLVMNPLSFVDFTEALSYYLLGDWPPAIILAYNVLIGLVWVLICSVFIASIIL